MNSRFFLLLLAMGMLVLSPSSQAALLVNGGFESPVIPPANFQTVVSGAEPGGFGWTVVTNNVDIFSVGVGGTTSAMAEGNQALDLVGTNVSVGAIEQSFATVLGSTYLLTFSYGNNPITGGSATAQVTVMDGANSLLDESVSHNTSTGTDFAWTLFSKTFVATGTSATLKFDNTAGTFNGGIFLDAVAVELAPSTGGGEVPEPSTLILLGSSIVCLVAFRRRIGRR